MNTRRVVDDLAAYRRRRGISQAAVGHRMGVTKVAICHLEKHPNPPEATVYRYAAALGITLTNTTTTHTKNVAEQVKSPTCTEAPQ